MDKAASGPRRQQQRALETRKALLDAATANFSARGFDGVSVRQLEEAAGVKRGLVAYHFGDKEQLWRDAVDQLFDELAREFRDRLATLGDIAPREAARGLVRAFVRFSAARPELNRLMLQESMSDSWRVTYIVDQHIRPLLETLMTALPESVPLFMGAGDPHRYYAFIGASAFVFSAEQECLRLFGCSPRTEEFIERQADLVEQLLLGD